MLNLSVNVDSRLLAFGDKATNEIESIYELVVVNVFGDDFAIADNEDFGEEKSQIMSFVDTSKQPEIPELLKPDISLQNFKKHPFAIYSIGREITPPPPKA